MKPMKPRTPGGPHAALALLMEQIAHREGGVAATGVEIAADFEGVSKFTLYKELDPDQRGEMPYVRVARLTSRFGATAAAEHLAQLAGGVFIPLPDAALAGSRLQVLSGQAFSEIGQMFEELGRIVEDGRIGDQEPDEFDREADEAIAKIVELKLQVRAEAERGEARASPREAGRQRDDHLGKIDATKN